VFYHFWRVFCGPSPRMEGTRLGSILRLRISFSSLTIAINADARKVPRGTARLAWRAVHPGRGLAALCGKALAAVLLCASKPAGHNGVCENPCARLGRRLYVLRHKDIFLWYIYIIQTFAHTHNTTHTTHNNTRTHVHTCITACSNISLCDSANAIWQSRFCSLTKCR